MFDYDQFCNTIQHLGLLYDQEERINAILHDPLYRNLNNDFMYPFTLFSPTIENDLVEALIDMYSDENYWISYFIYELNFGERWYEGMIIDDNGNDIKLQSVTDLWNLLMENLHDN